MAVITLRANAMPLGIVTVTFTILLFGRIYAPTVGMIVTGSCL
jgi:hypothetical protein